MSALTQVVTDDPRAVNGDKRKKRVLSGVQPSGTLHIGNYIGALSLWAERQSEYDNLFCVVNLHALTIPEAVKPEQLRHKTREVAALYIACGINPDESVIFLQSDVAAHPYLSWVLGCCTPVGWLQRMTQYKIKTQRTESVGSGLLNYPVLQAADILIYQADYVPVGDDQAQHVELTRDIAQRFNHLFGEYFNVPQLLTRTSGMRIMAFDDPAAKMSKSVAVTHEQHAVGLLDDPDMVRKTVMSAVTDSGNEVRFEYASPGVKNLLTVYEVLSGESRPTVEAQFAGQGYGYLKRAVVDVIVETLQPIQEQYRQITADTAYLDNILADGAARASEIAEKTLREVRELVGI